MSAGSSAPRTRALTWRVLLASELVTNVDVAVLLASELVTNSVRHGGSAVAGGKVTVTVSAGGRGVRVAVAERSGPGVPVMVPDVGAEAVESRGMRLVDALATRWGYEREAGRR